MSAIYEFYYDHSDISTLHVAVNDSIDGLLGITKINDLVKIEFEQALTQPQQSELFTLVQQHNPETKTYKIYDYIPHSSYMNKSIAPIEVCYSTGLNIRLHPKRTFVKGVMTEVVYYAAYDGTTYSLPCVVESYVYVYNSVNMATSRTLTIKWYYTDGTIGLDSKQMIKYYAGDESVKESSRRRENILDLLQLEVVGLIAITQQVSQIQAIVAGSQFMNAYNAQIQSWLKTPALYAFQTKLNSEISGQTSFQWLFNDIGGGTTIRSYILSKINY